MRKILKHNPISAHHQALDNATAFELSEIRIKRQIENLFFVAREEVFEDGMESEFSRELVLSIKQYGDPVIEVMSELILNDSVSPEVASEALRWIGYIEHKDTHDARLRLLEQSLTSSSLRVRDGAVLGLSFLDDPRATGSLRKAMELENSKLLRRNMQQVLEQLEGEL